MEGFTMEKLLSKTNGSIFKLCNLASLRAMELNSGAKKLIEAHPSEKVTTTAIKEIAEGKVRLKGAK